VELIRMISYLIVGWLVVTLMDGQRTQRSELKLANSRLSQYATTLEQLTLSRERNRMARELHDILAHTLSGVAVELEAVRALWDAEPDRARAMLGSSLASTREGLTETRRALQALRASPLEDIGLGLAVRTQAESTAARLGLDLTLEIDETLGELSPDVEQCFYRIAQEALTNAAQHAGARRIRLVLTQRDGTLRLEVSDDGRGFDLYQVDQDSQFGLQGMRERAEMIGADFTLNTIPGEGTSITLIYGGGHDTTADLG
jgi:signal transduction histidine kinase